MTSVRDLWGIEALTVCTRRLLLNPSVELLPVTALPAVLRGRLPGLPSDVVVSQRGARTPAVKVSSDTAELLKQFRKPRSLISGIGRFSRARRSDPLEIWAD